MDSRRRRQDRAQRVPGGAPARLLRIGLCWLGLGLSGLAAAEPTMPRAPYVLPQTVRVWQAGGVKVTFIDVREPAEFIAGHLDGAVNVPYSQIERRSAEIAKDHPQVVYCIHSSWRAPYAANALADLGFDNVHVLDGGISAWHAGGQAVVAASASREPAIAPYPEGLSRSLRHPRDRVHDGQRELTLDELSACDGKEGRPAYVALEGVVYDVTNSRLWRAGEHDPSHGQALAGRDLTPVFAEAPHGRENLRRFPVVGRLVPAGGEAR